MHGGSAVVDAVTLDSTDRPSDRRAQLRRKTRLLINPSHCALTDDLFRIEHGECLRCENLRGR